MESQPAPPPRRGAHYTRWSVAYVPRYDKALSIHHNDKFDKGKIAVTGYYTFAHHYLAAEVLIIGVIAMPVGRESSNYPSLATLIIRE